jgi:uncharacterized protein involved in exopolysaccharide biosynthesis
VDMPDDITFARVLLTTWSYRRSITLICACCVGMAVTIAYLWPPVYRAEALVAFNDDQEPNIGLSSITSQFTGLASVAGLNLGANQRRKEVALALITSRSLLESFIREKDLLLVLFASRWARRDNTWRSSSVAPTIADGIELLRKHVLTVSEDRRTGLIRVAVEFTDPVRAADWANELVSRVNELTRQQAIADARNSQSYLQAELGKTTVVELRESIYRLIEMELKKEMIATVRSEYSFRQVDRARPPRPKDFVRPNRILLLVFGLVVGIGVGVSFALSHNALLTSRT